MENRPEDAVPGGFTMVQNRSVARSDISLHALGLLVKLLRRRNGGTHLCCPSYEALRKDCKHNGKMPSPRSIADWLRELALAREVAWVHTGRHSVYHFPGDAEFEAASDALVAALTATTTVAETTTATVVIGETTTATVEQHYQNGSGTATATVVKQEVLNKKKLTRHSTPTELTTTTAGRPPAKKVAAPEQPIPTVEAKPTEQEPTARAKQAGDPPAQPVLVDLPPAVATVLDTLGLSGVAAVRAVTAIVAAYPAVNHALAAACCAEWCANKRKKASAAAYRNWCDKEGNGAHGENRGGAGQGGAGGAPRARAGDHRQPANPQHAAHAAKLDW